MNPLLALRDYGQSIWLDYLRRGVITSGELRRCVDEDGLRSDYHTDDLVLATALAC